MKIIYERKHTARPEDYEGVTLRAGIEVDLDNQADAEEFEGLDYKEIGAALSAVVDDLLDTDVDRTLRLDGQHINDTHLWAFYGYDEEK